MFYEFRYLRSARVRPVAHRLFSLRYAVCLQDVDDGDPHYDDSDSGDSRSEIERNVLSITAFDLYNRLQNSASSPSLAHSSVAAESGFQLPLVSPPTVVVIDCRSAELFAVSHI